MDNNSTYTQRRVFLILAGLIAVVILFSIMVFIHQSLRLDEAQSLWQTSRSPARILQIIGQDVHVPFYHFLLHFWQFLFSNSIPAARMLSLIFFLISIPALFYLGKVAHGPFVGILGSTLFAISPFMNWYGNEIRMYSLFTLLTILNQYFFMRIYKHKVGRAWWGYTITALIGIYTHYFFWLVLLTEAVFFFLYRRDFPRGSFKRFVSVIVLLLVAFTPWILYVKNLGSIANTQPALIRPTTVNLFNTFSQFIFGFHDDHLNTVIVSLWPLTVLLTFWALRKNKRVDGETIYFILSIFIPIVVAFMISIFVRPIYVSRYLIFTVPSLYIFLSWIISTYPPRLARGLRYVVIIGMLVMLGIQVVDANTPVKENYREASEYLEKETTPRDVIVVSAPFTIYPVEYYYRGPAAINTLPLWNRFGTGGIPGFNIERLPEEIEVIKSNHERLWLLLSYDQGYEEEMRIYLDTNLERIAKKNFSPGLNLYVYRLRYDVPVEIPET